MDFGFNHPLLTPYDFNSDLKGCYKEGIHENWELYIELKSWNSSFGQSPIWLTIKLTRECFWPKGNLRPVLGSHRSHAGWCETPCIYILQESTLILCWGSILRKLFHWLSSTGLKDRSLSGYFKVPTSDKTLTKTSSPLYNAILGTGLFPDC